MPVIYIDILFLVNLWIDFLLLSAVVRLLRLPLKRWRLLLGSLIGAGGSCALFLLPLSWPLSWLLRVGGTLLLIRITFPFHGIRQYFKTVFVFFAVSAVFSGLAMLLWYLGAPDGFMVVNGIVYYDAPASLLILFTSVSYVAVCVLEYCLRKRAPVDRICTLHITHGGKNLVCRCLYDSGSTLREPFSGKPAVLMDRAAAAAILPREMTGVSPPTKNMRYIPYKSLGGEGLLPAFLPEHMSVTAAAGKPQDISGSYLAVCEALGHGEYTALVGTDIGEILFEGGK